MARGINLVFNYVRLKRSILIISTIVQNKMIWILHNEEDNLNTYLQV